MKNLMYVLGIAGLIVGWGYFGAQQARKLDYDCKLRVEKLCFVWEKNEIGRAKDKIRDIVDKTVNP